MFETILLLCSLACVIPISVLAVVYYNFRRQMKGLQEVSGGEAMRDMLQDLLGSQQTRTPRSNSNSKSKSTNKVKAQRPEAEDAEFTEIG